jgi:azurin
MLMACAAAPALANECQLSIESNDLMQYSARQLTAPASCPEVEVTLHHVGKQAIDVMGHNWVLTRSRDANAIANLGMSAGIKNNYLPQGDARVIAATRLVGGGESATVKFDTAALRPDEDYTFFCSAPGHIAVMKGKFALRK